ncbi:MAG: hypothetical protein ACRDG4_16915 [Chloroflexota bacterium]
MANAVNVDVQPTSLTVGPNSPALTFMVSVHNGTSVVDQFKLGIEELPEEWYTLPSGPVSLFPGAREMIRISVKPPDDARAGDYPMRVIVTSTADPGLRTDAQAVVRISANNQFDLDMTPKKVIGRKGRYTLMVRNTGNADLSLTLEATDDEERCRYHFETEDVVLEPGRRQSVRLTVRPQRSGWVGQRAEYGFQVIAKPAQGQTKTIQGRIVHTPRLRTWRPVISVFKFWVVVALIAAFVASQGGISGVQQKAPGWKADVTKATCDRMNVFCPTPTVVPKVIKHKAPTARSGT